jgi:tripartite-type tricarboxylate transporter receptor subunit TctC
MGVKMKAFVLAACAVLAMFSLATAQPFPSKPITIIVPLAAGGAVDRMVRILGESMRETLGQPVLVENIGGAGGTLGIARVARSPADGYTLSIGTWGTHVVNGAIFSPPYDLVKDFEPVALLPSVPYWMVGKKDLPPKDLKELIAWLKANGEKASGGTVGGAGGATMCSVYFQNASQTKYQLIPYKGGAPALRDLVAGQIDVMCDLAANSLPQVQSGHIKAYAVMAKRRWFGAPDVPTAEEAGLPGVEVTTWHGAWAPKGTPAEVLDRLSKALMTAMADPAIRKRLADMGMDIPPPGQQTAATLAAHQAEEIRKWWPVVEASGLKQQK